jgi:dienelactone hydrolase
MYRPLIMRSLWAGLLLAATLGAQLPEDWFQKPILQEPVRRSQMYAFVNANIPPLPVFRSVEDWERHRKETGTRILRLLGIDDILAKHKPRFINKGKLDRDGYVIEKINYESYPGMFVPALVYVPKALTAEAPAIIGASGHALCDSKASASMQARAYNLVRRGFIVMAYDYLGAWERASRDPCSKSTFQEDHRNGLFSYTSRTATGIEVLDGIRAIDYLYSRPDVDRSRLAFTGPSGGGNSTYWTAAMDERVTLAVPVSSATSYEWWIKGDYAWDHHQRPVGLRSFADIGTLYAMIAPRPLLIINGRPEMESMPLPAAMQSYEYAWAIYRLYGRENAIAFRESETGHGYQADKRVLLYLWLNRWFFAGKIPRGTADLPFTPEPKENLAVGLPPGNLNIQKLYRQWLDETPAPALPAGLSEAKEFQAAGRASLAPLLNRVEPQANPKQYLREDYRLQSGDYLAERFELEVAPDLLLPAIFVRKQGKSKYKTILYLDKARGTSPEAAQLLNLGYAILFFDPRGTGEAEWGGTRTSNWALLVGRPPVGMWAEDISKVATYALGRPDVESVAVVGRGAFGKAALYAAALDTRLAAACITTDTLSYRQEADSGTEHIFADVPGILQWGDTAQIAALVAPRPLAVLSAGLPIPLIGYYLSMPRFEISKDTVSEDALRQNYAWTVKFYELFGADARMRAGSGGPDPSRLLVDWFKDNY